MSLSNLMDFEIEKNAYIIEFLKENETCSYTTKNILGIQKSYISESFDFPYIGNVKRQMCVKVSNKEGLTRNVCSSNYLVDSVSPKISLNTSGNEILNGCYNAVNIIKNNYSTYFKVTYGFSGGKEVYGAVSKTGSYRGYDEYGINVTAVGNNGLKYNFGREIRCNKSVAFVGDSLSKGTANEGLKSISLSPATVNVDGLGYMVPYPQIINRINSTSLSYDKVIITAGIYEKNAGGNNISKAIGEVATAAKKRFGSKVIFILYSNSNDLYISRAKSVLNSMDVRYIIFMGKDSYFISDSEVISLNGVLLSHI